MADKQSLRIGKLWWFKCQSSRGMFKAKKYLVISLLIFMQIATLSEKLQEKFFVPPTDECIENWTAFLKKVLNQLAHLCECRKEKCIADQVQGKASSNDSSAAISCNEKEDLSEQLLEDNSEISDDESEIECCGRLVDNEACSNADVDIDCEYHDAMNGDENDSNENLFPLQHDCTADLQLPESLPRDECVMLTTPYRELMTAPVSVCNPSATPPSKEAIQNPTNYDSWKNDAVNSHGEENMPGSWSIQNEIEVAQEEKAPDIEEAIHDVETSHVKICSTPMPSSENAHLRDAEKSDSNGADHSKGKSSKWGSSILIAWLMAPAAVLYINGEPSVSMQSTPQASTHEREDENSEVVLVNSAPDGRERTFEEETEAASNDTESIHFRGQETDPLITISAIEEESGHIDDQWDNQGFSPPLPNEQIVNISIEEEDRSSHSIFRQDSERWNDITPVEQENEDVWQDVDEFFNFSE